MTINEKQDQIVEEFNQFDDWMDKYSLLIDMGNSLQPIEENHKNPQKRSHYYRRLHTHLLKTGICYYEFEI